MNKITILTVMTISCIVFSYALPTQMKAVIQEVKFGQLSVSTNVTVPTPSDGEVLIEVHYSALNRMDLLQAKGKYPLPPGTTDILGVEVSGVVVSVSPTVSEHFQIGDEVMALLPGGGYAEYCVCDARTAVKIPSGISLLTASAIPEAFMTAYQLLFLVGKVQPKETILLHAAASSVGQAAIQMAVQKGIKVLATARSKDKVDISVGLGAAAGVVVTNNNQFSSALKFANGGNTVDVILDPVGSSYWTENLQIISYDGRIVSYGLLSGGVIPDELNSDSSDTPSLLKQLLFKRVSLLGSTLRARSVEYKYSLINQLLNDEVSGFPAVSTGRIRVNISNIFPIDDVIEAHSLMQANKNIGKIILQVKAPSFSAEGRSEL